MKYGPGCSGVYIFCPSDIGTPISVELESATVSKSKHFTVAHLLSRSPDVRHKKLSLGIRVTGDEVVVDMKTHVLHGDDLTLHLFSTSDYSRVKIDDSLFIREWPRKDHVYTERPIDEMSHYWMPVVNGLIVDDKWSISNEKRSTGAGLVDMGDNKRLEIGLGRSPSRDDNRGIPSGYNEEDVVGIELTFRTHHKRKQDPVQVVKFEGKTIEDLSIKEFGKYVKVAKNEDFFEIEYDQGKFYKKGLIIERESPYDEVTDVRYVYEEIK